MTEAKAFEFDDLQGLVRFAHGHLSETCFLLLDVVDIQSALEWLGSAPITTAESIRPPPDNALQVAFSASGLRTLGVPDAVIEDFSDEFVTGMASERNRSRRLGDVGANDPQQWTWGGPEREPPHMLLMLYTRSGGIADWEATVAGANFDQAFRLRARLPTDDLGRIEPFGFIDGISQPKIDWQREMSTDVHTRDRYANLLALGETVLGYPNEYGLYTQRPLIDARSDPRAAVLPAAEDQPDRQDFGRNGCYLVLRQLHQDVPKFWQFLDREADSDEKTREQLAAAIVGRHRDGTPLVAAAKEPILGIEGSGDKARLNQFTFDNDLDGHRCPIGAHVRRSNPRSGDFPHRVTGLISRLRQIFGFGRQHRRDDLIASTRFHRIVRRGRAYGPLLTPEDAVKPDAPRDDRGLEFICLVANISRQFEFVQHAWSMNTKFGGVRNESDPLLGNREPLLNGPPTDHFALPRADGPAQCLEGLPQFVTVRGGAYFFMPGIRALRYIAHSAAVQSRSD